MGHNTHSGFLPLLTKLPGPELLPSPLRTCPVQPSAFARISPTITRTSPTETQMQPRHMANVGVAMDISGTEGLGRSNRPPYKHFHQHVHTHGPAQRNNCRPQMHATGKTSTTTEGSGPQSADLCEQHLSL